MKRPIAAQLKHPALLQGLASFFVVLLFLGANAAVYAEDKAPPAEEKKEEKKDVAKVSFRQDVANVLLQNCSACHGPKKAEGGYRVDTFEQLMRPGESGEAAVTAQDIEDSELLRRIISDDESERMPLEADPLSKEDVAKIRQWIEQGAVYDAKDPKLPLAAIVPPPEHPAPPEAYPQSMPAAALVFSANGEELFVGGYHELTVWNTKTGALLRRIRNVDERTLALALQPQGDILAVGGGSPGRRGEVRLFDAKTGAMKSVLATTTDVVLDVAFNPAGDRLAVAGADAIIRVFDVASGEETLTITSHSDWVSALAWSDDGKQLASASRDKTSKVFDAKTGDLLITYSGHGQPVKGVAFHPDGKQVFSAAADKKIHLWKIADGKKVKDIASFGAEAYRLTKFKGGLLASSADKSVRQFNLADGKQVRVFKGLADWALSTAVNENAKLVAAGGFDGMVYIWNLEDGKEIAKLQSAPGFTLQAAKN